MFVDEVKKRRPKMPQLTPAGLRTLTSTFRDYAAQIATLDTESDGLERRVSDLVNVAYGLSAAEIDLMWRVIQVSVETARLVAALPMEYISALVIESSDQALSAETFTAAGANDFPTQSLF